jgi:acetyl-CoA synthetase
MCSLDSTLASLSLDADLKARIAQSGLAPEKDPAALWDFIRTQVLKPSHPIALHRALADWAFQHWDTKKQGPRPIWRTNAEVQAKTNLHRLMQNKGLKSFEDIYHWSITESRAFWVEMITRLGIPFKNNYKPDAKNLADLTDPTSPKWLPGAKLNIADACFAADANATALVYGKEGSAELKRYSFAELNTLANRVASALSALGCKQGDRIAIDMPMNAESIYIFLGILKLGGAVVCLADSFKAPDLDVRLEVAQPVKWIFTQDRTGGIKHFPLYPEVIKAKHCPPAIVLSSEAVPAKLLRKGDMTWEDFIAKGADNFESAAMDPEADCAILFSSSTTSPKEKEGEKPKAPKAIPWRAHTAIKSAADAYLHHNLMPGKTLCWYTNLGWMMGSFAIFGALINKATLAIFDGAAVSTDFIEFVKAAKVNVLGLVPGISEAWERTGLTDNCEWDSIECFSSTGSPSNPQNYFYLMSRAPGYAPVFEYMGGTEIGGGYLCSTFLQNASPSCFTTPNLGTELFINDGRVDAPKNEAFIVIPRTAAQCPPMGLSTALLNYDHHEKYFGQNLRHPDTGALLREHGDLVVPLPGGFYKSDGRADDGMNINGIKTSSLDIENYVKDAHIAGLKEIAAIAVRPPEGGEDWLVIYAVADNQLKKEDLYPKIRDAIKARNPQLAKLQDVVLINALPLTASGKLRRRYLQDLYLENQSGKHL